MSDYLQLSFEGPREIHDRVKYEGAYERFVQAREIAEEDGIQIHTQTVITKVNLNSIDFILDTAREHGFRAFFQPLGRTYFYEDVSPAYLRPTREELGGTIRKLMRAKRGAQRRYVGNSLTELKYFIHPDSAVRCHAGRLFAYVHTNGDVYPCWTPPDGLEVLNCRKEGFRKAFEGIPPFRCDSCAVASQVKWNCLGSFRPEAIFNTISHMLSAHRRARKM